MDYDKLIKANTKLVDEKRTLLRDINILISYIEGDETLKEEVDNIAKYYNKLYEKRWTKYGEK